MRTEDNLDAYARMVQNEGSAAMEVGGNTWNWGLFLLSVLVTDVLFLILQSGWEASSRLEQQTGK